MSEKKYSSKSDPHPVEVRLRELGVLTLVGSRAQQDPQVATPDSDYDFYLWPWAEDVAKCPPGQYAWETPEMVRLAQIRKALEEIGFKRLPGEGGPYGSDEAIEGIWRLDAANVFGRNFSHVDVIVARAEVGVWRVKVLQDLVFWSAPMGRMTRGLKAEKAWGAFWYAMARFRQMERTGQLKGL